MLRKWDDLPDFMKCDEVRKYYDSLSKKRISLFIKRCFDIVVGFVVFIILAIPMLVIAVMIKTDSPGPILYRQERVTSYGKKFKIHKFRTMVNNADRIGSTVTISGDVRITKVGVKLRQHRLDEIPQVFDILSGNMSFVGTRPEATKYVERYTKEMNATLLMPAGITSEASIRYKDEALLLDKASNVDEVYVDEILPQKMIFNLNSIKTFTFWNDIKTMFRTVFAIMGKEYE